MSPRERSAAAENLWASPSITPLGQPRSIQRRTASCLAFTRSAMRRGLLAGSLNGALTSLAAVTSQLASGVLTGETMGLRAPDLPDPLPEQDLGSAPAWASGPTRQAGGSGDRVVSCLRVRAVASARRALRSRARRAIIRRTPRAGHSAARTTTGRWPPTTALRTRLGGRHRQAGVRRCASAAPVPWRRSPSERPRRAMAE
jgi:hypothetical protein